MCLLRCKIGVLVCLVALYACGGNGTPTPDPGTIVPDSGGDLVSSDADVGCVEGPQPDDPCMSCTCTDGDWNCIPAQIGASCAPDDCCLGSATCVQCDPEDPTSCPDSGLQCIGSPVKTCSRNDQCSVDVTECIEGSCECVPIAKEDGIECDADPNDCTNGDQCFEGLCVVGTQRSRSDGNPCTVGTCIKGEIEQSSIDGNCSDSNPCTVGDFCEAGTCIAGDEVQCVADVCSISAACDPEVGSCVQVPAPDDSSCTNANPCVLNSSCQAGSCIPVNLKSCPSSGPCFVGVCDTNSGSCVEESKVEGASCEHPNFCVSQAVCNSGACIMVQENSCDDGNPCTMGVCNQADGGGCIQTPVPDGSSCISDDPCAQTSICSLGVCETLSLIDCDDGNPCTQDNCDNNSGDCIHPNATDGLECAINDNECVLAATCFSGDCAATEAVVCNDGNSCTVGSCDPTSGTCDHLSLDEGVECASGDACFLAGNCEDQVCVPSQPLICNDDEPCTDDSCHSIFGCQFFHNEAGCDDGSVCTTADVCTEGSCVGTSPQQCDDDDPCTLDSCDSVGGCSNIPNPEGCQYFQLDSSDTYDSEVAGLSNCGPWVYDRDCPTGYVAVGYYGTIAGPIESITLDCRKLMGDGTLGEAASGVTFGNDAGGEVFAPAPCADDRILNGMEINVGTWWNRLIGHCHLLSSIVANQGGYQSTIAPVQGTVGGPSYTNQCPPGYALTGFFGRATSVGICRVAAKCTRLLHFD
jgi:hypothetical protein